MGGEFCPNCKFVPIGAGLKAGTKKKKKHKKYVEPGSSRGFLVVVFLGLLGYGTYKYEPWKDDWEFVRALMGQGRHHSLVGEWEVVKTVAFNKQQGMVARDNVRKGSFSFGKKGGVKFELMHPQSQTTASGQYIQEGTVVAMRDLRTTGDAVEPIKPIISMNLAWTGNDNVIAMDKTEAIYLHRRKAGSWLTTFMQMDLKKGAKPDDGKEPEMMRGMVGEMKRSLQETDEPAGNN